MTGSIRSQLLAHMRVAARSASTIRRAAVRRDEAKRLERDGYEPILKHARWCSAMRSRLDPMKKVAASLRTHRELLLISKNRDEEPILFRPNRV